MRVGDTSLDEEYEANSFTVDVATIKMHPDYSNSTGQNDIAVLELVEPVSLTEYPNIKPACLPEAGALFPGEAIVTGWGTDALRSPKTAYLNEVGVTVFADGDCGAMNSEMTEDMICAGLKEGGKGACEGDSGGPLIAADPARNNSMSLIGVGSESLGCGNLGIYAEVSHFVGWLMEQMPDLNTCPAPAPSCGNCVFPFIDNGFLSDRCTTIDGGDKPWCATSVDGQGSMLDHEYCTDPTCPGLEGNSEQMSVHPKNAVGNCCKFFL